MHGVSYIPANDPFSPIKHSEANQVYLLRRRWDKLKQSFRRQYLKCGPGRQQDQLNLCNWGQKEGQIYRLGKRWFHPGWECAWHILGCYHRHPEQSPSVKLCTAPSDGTCLKFAGKPGLAYSGTTVVVATQDGHSHAKLTPDSVVALSCALPPGGGSGVLLGGWLKGFVFQSIEVSLAS
jgi:hypothetical protein